MTDTQTTDTPAEVDALTAYKAKVRAKALQLKQDRGWCDDETNRHLVDLDLEPLPEPQRFVFEVTNTGVVQYSVTAYTEAEAREAVQRNYETDVRRATARSHDRGPRYGLLKSLTYSDGGLKLQSDEGDATS
jgi:hypothetical protein